MNHETDDERAERILGPSMRAAELVARALNAALNPETMFKLAPTPMHKTPAEINQLWDGGPVLPATIDLRGKSLDIRYEFHGSFRGKQQWTCWDHNSYDGDESAMGYGESKELALVDLLEKIAPEPEPAPRAGYVVHSSPFEPETIVDKPLYRDED